MQTAYAFSWQDLGDLNAGRPNLGGEASVLVYRLMQCTFKEVLCQSLGGERTSELFVEAGTIAGREFCRNVLDCSLPFAEFVAELKAKLVDLKVGVLRIEQADQQTARVRAYRLGGPGLLRPARLWGDRLRLRRRIHRRHFH